MLEVGAKAPSFKLEDHLGHTIDSSKWLGKGHLMLLFYPLDFTPT